MPSGLRNTHRVAIVGASSLRGKELGNRVLEDRHFPASDIVLLDENVARPEPSRKAAGEPTCSSARWYARTALKGRASVFFAGSRPQDAEQNWRVAQSVPVQSSSI